MLVAPETALPDSVEALTPARRIFDLVVVILTGFATTAVANVMLIFGGDRKYSALELNLGITESILTELACLAVLFTVFRYRLQPVSTIGLRFSKEDFLPGVALSFAALAAFAVVYYSAHAVFPSLASSSESSYDFGQYASTSPPLLLLLMLLNPCFEEIVVRGYLSTELGYFTSRKWVVIAVPSLFQGAYHLYQGRVAAMGLTAMFLVFSIYFVKTRRLVPVIVAHAIFDFTLIWRLWA